MNTIKKKPALVLCGFMGCGKTALGTRLAQALDYTFADTDDMLFEQTQMTLAQMFALGGETYFRDREHEIVCQAAALKRTVISTGGGVMTYERNARILAQNAEIIHIHRSFEACYAAILCRRDRPIAGRKSKEELHQMYDARLAAYERYASFTLENDGTVQEALDRLLHWLKL